MEILLPDADNYIGWPILFIYNSMTNDEPPRLPNAKQAFDGRRLINFLRRPPPTLPERLIRPARLDAIVEVSLRQVRLPELALLLIVLLDVHIAAAQSRRALRTVGQRVMDHVSGVAGRPERLVDALRRQRIIGLRRIAYRHPGVTAEVP